MAISQDDITAEKFFSKVTYASDATPGTKLPIPDGDFIMAAVSFNLVSEIKKLTIEINKLRSSL